jgi:K+/H+ antiporter YhaU regulatory subunit KhtT
MRVQIRNLPVSESNLKKSAARLLGQKLVSTEVHYIQRTLGASATQQEIDATVVAVRKMPWASIVEPE